MMLAEEGYDMNHYEFAIAGTDMLVSTAAQHITDYEVYTSLAPYDMAQEHHPIWWLAYPRAEDSCYKNARHLLQTAQATTAEAIGNWWLDLFPRQARLSIIYQDRQPPERSGKPKGLSMYVYCNHWTTNLWFKQVTEDVKVPTDYHLVQKWSAVGMVPYSVDYSPEYTHGSNMAAA